MIGSTTNPVLHAPYHLPKAAINAEHQQVQQTLTDTSAASAFRARMTLLPALPSLEYERVQSTRVALVVARFDFTSATLNTCGAILVASCTRITLNTVSADKLHALLATCTFKLVCSLRSNRSIPRRTLARWRLCVAAVLRATTWLALPQTTGSPYK